MEKIQQFLRGFYEMTFQGKGAFWGVIAALLLLILVYAVSDRLRQKLGRKSGLLLLVPALRGSRTGYPSPRRCCWARLPG